MSFFRRSVLVLGFVGLMFYSPKKPLNVDSLPNKPPEISFCERKKKEPVSIGDYTILEKVSKEEISSLEEILEPSDQQPQFDHEKSLKINYSKHQFPEILYHLDLRHKNGKITVRPLGTAFLLNNEGFFVTAYHTFERYIDEQRVRNDNSSFMLLHDPVYGFTLPARPLIFSGRDEYDILLGKIDFDQEFEIETTKISETDKPFYEVIYAVTYHNRDYILNDLFEEIWDNSGFDRDDSSCFSFNQQGLISGRESNMKPRVSISTIEDVRNEDGWKFLGEGAYSFKAEIIPGNSGSPVFDSRNLLIGVVTSIPNKEALMTIDGGELPDLGIYTGPFQIREMIETYRDFCID